MLKRTFLALLIVQISLLATASLPSSEAWSNGGWSSDAKNPDYGTHDFIAQHGLDWVPDEMDFWIRDNLAIYLYGTELPDNRRAVLGDGIGDTQLHHIYYRANGHLQDDASAERAEESCEQVLYYLATKDYSQAAKWMGVASHYIADVAVFGHVMGKATDWGAEKHHSDYEDWVNSMTNRYNASFTLHLKFDGKLESISAYDAALNLAHDTTFDDTGKGRTAKWMDENYSPENQAFQGRVYESVNLAVNLLADVINSVSQTAGIPEFRTPVIVLLLATAVLIIFCGQKPKDSDRNLNIEVSF